MKDRHFDFIKKKGFKAMRTAIERNLNTLAETYCDNMFSSVCPIFVLAGNSEYSFIWDKYNSKQITERLRC